MRANKKARYNSDAKRLDELLATYWKQWGFVPVYKSAGGETSASMFVHRYSEIDYKMALTNMIQIGMAMGL